MVKEFQSQVLRGGNIIRPQVVTIDENSITISQRTKFLISNNKKTINFKNISNTQVTRNPLFSKITIETFGGSQIVIDNLSHDDADEIMIILNS